MGKISLNDSHIDDFLKIIANLLTIEFEDVRVYFYILTVDVCNRKILCTLAKILSTFRNNVYVCVVFNNSLYLSMYRV